MSDHDENTKPKKENPSIEEEESQDVQTEQSPSLDQNTPYQIPTSDSLNISDEDENDDLFLSDDRTNTIIPMPAREELLASASADKLNGVTERIIPHNYQEEEEAPEEPSTQSEESHRDAVSDDELLNDDLSISDSPIDQELTPDLPPPPDNVISISATSMDDDDDDGFLDDLIIEDVDDDFPDELIIDDVDDKVEAEAEPEMPPAPHSEAIDSPEELIAQTFGQPEQSSPPTDLPQENVEEVPQDAPVEEVDYTAPNGLSLEDREALLLSKEAKDKESSEEDTEDDMIFADNSLSKYKLPLSEVLDDKNFDKKSDEASVPEQPAVVAKEEEEDVIAPSSFDDGSDVLTTAQVLDEASDAVKSKYEVNKGNTEETNITKLKIQQNQKVRFSLKLKLLTTICTLLLITVGLYVVFAKNLFFSDKKAYVYENSLGNLEGINKKLMSDLELYNYQTAFLSTLSNLDQKSLKKFIKLNKSNIGYFKISETGNFQEKHYNPNIDKEKLNEKSMEIIEDLAIRLAIETEEPQAIRLYNKEFNFPSLAVLVKDFEGKRVTNNVLIVSLDSLKDFVFSDQTFKTYLIDKDKKSFFRSVENIDAFMAKINDNPVNKGTVEFQEMNKLISFVKLPHFNATFLTVVDYDQVFGAAYFLIKKSIYFGLMLLSLAAFIGIILSTNIAKPIQKFVDFTRAIAGNDFSGRINLKTRDELGVLATAFNYMSEEIEDLLGSKELMIKDLIATQGKLKELNEGLEAKVSERTASLENAYMFIDAAVNSLDQGLFVINREGEVHSFATKSCENLFNQNVIGSKFPDLIPKEHPDHDSTLYKWIEVVFQEMLPFYSSKGLGPKEVSHGKITDDEYKHIRLNYFAMRNKEEELSNIVVVATEDTAEMKTKALFDEQKDKVDMILTVLSRKDAFLRFVKESKKIVKYFESYSMAGDPNFEQAKYYLHTLKGNFSLFSVTTVSKCCHEIESNIMKGEISDFNMQVVELLTRIKDFMVFASKLVGHDLLGNEEFYEVSKERVNQLGSYIKTGRFNEMLTLFNEMFIYKGFEEILSSFEESTIQLANSLGKEINPFVYVTNGFKIDPELFNGVLGTLVHLFRNIADHAIESPSERQAANKSAAGTIRVEILPVTTEEGDNPDYFCLAISDDGKGIDHNIIAKVLKEKGLWDDWKQYQPEHLVSAIFEDGFSTSEQVTDLSGRGVGMSAIKEEIVNIGGKIKIQTVKGEGSTFFLILPRDPQKNENVLAA